ncbi:hypothetical protein BH23ACT9_BH23ACT9_16440 [soil metagenome]
MSTRRLLLPALVLVLGLTAVACSPSVVAFTIGECVNLPETSQIADYETVDCDEVHDAETFALPQHPGGPDDAFPGAPEIEAFADERCDGAFEPYVGTPYASSELFYTALIPSEQSWDDAEDREVVCLLVGAPAGGGFEQLQGSKQGSGE